MTRAAYLHVGAPKSGTTYLQDRLRRNARPLAAHGLHVPAVVPFENPARAHFRAALDLLEQDWGGRPGHADGYWDRLVAKVRRTNGSVVISHEILAPAPPATIARALGDLGDREVHILYTARDLGRELASAWQESIRQGRSWTFREFLDGARKNRHWFSRALDLPRVVEAWSCDLPPGRTHVVTSGGATSGGEESDLLWQRFCAALQVSPEWAPHPAGRSNPYLGAAETQVLRLLNRRGGEGPRHDPHRNRYVGAVTGPGAQSTAGGVRIALPPQDHGWVAERARSWVDWLTAHHVMVHGDVSDLLPRPARSGWVDPDHLPRGAVLEAALEVVDRLAGAQRHRRLQRTRLVEATRLQLSRHLG